MLNFCLTNVTAETPAIQTDRPKTHHLKPPRLTININRKTKGISIVGTSTDHNKVHYKTNELNETLSKPQTKHLNLKNLRTLSPRKKMSLNFKIGQSPRITILACQTPMEKGLTTYRDRSVSPKVVLQSCRSEKKIPSKIQCITNVNRIDTKNTAMDNIFNSGKFNSSEAIKADDTNPLEQVTFALNPQEMFMTEAKRCLDDIVWTGQTEVKTDEPIIYEDGHYKFNRNQLNTVYSIEYQEKVSMPQHLIQKLYQVGRPDVKLAYSSKCKLVESTVVQPIYIVQQSIIKENLMLDTNFQILNHRIEGQQKLLVTKEKNIGLLILIKTIDKRHLERISKVMLLHKIMQKRHPAIIQVYHAILDQNQSYLLLTEYYDGLLADLDIKPNDKVVQQMVGELLMAFDFLEQQKIVCKITLKDVAYVNGCFKLCGLENWRRAYMDEGDIKEGYLKDLSLIIEEIYSKHKMTMSQNVEKFVCDLLEGKCQHEFLRQNLNK